MLKTILTHGAVAGIVAGGCGSILALTMGESIPEGWAMAIGYATMLIALAAVFVGVKRYRDRALGGAIGFWPALGMGVAMSLIAAVLYAIGWEIALFGIGGPDAFLDGYIARLRAGGEGSAEAVRQMEAMRASYRNPLIRVPITASEFAPVGVLASLAIAALLRNPRFLPARAAAV